MKKFKVIILSLIIIACIISPLSTYAAAHDNGETSILLDQILTNAFANENTIQIKNNLGHDVTNEYINFIKDEYRANNHKSIRDLLAENNLSLSYTFEEEIRSNTNQGITPYGKIEVTKVVNKIDYHVGWGKKLGLQKEWAVSLKGTFVYDDITGKIITASSPRMSLYKASWGIMFSPYIDRVSTNSPSINSSKTQVSFSGSYEMMGEFAVDIKGFPIGTTESYGFYQVSFSATPSSPPNI